MKEDSALHAFWIKWFLTLPVYLDLYGIRIIHACWHGASVNLAQPWLGNKNQLIKENLAMYFDKRSQVYNAIEVLLKGPELELPEGLTFYDADNKSRKKSRLAWWKKYGAYQDICLAAIDFESEAFSIDSTALLEQYATDRPIFIGHYWLNEPPCILSDTVVCVDYSVAAGGKLVAYRHELGLPLSNESFMCQPALSSSL